MEIFITKEIAITRARSRIWFGKVFWRNRYLFLLLLPMMVWYVMFRYVPIGGSILAFKDYKFSKGIMRSDWAGLKHFQKLFESPEFSRIFRNTILISLYKIIFQFPAPVILALMLNEVRIAIFRRTVQTITYIPFFISWVVYGGLIAFLLSPTFGPVNIALEFFGFKRIFFLATPGLFRSLLVITAILRETGYGAIIYLAALSTIDPQLYEAAVMDGANKWRQLWHVTLPGMSSTIIVLLIIRIGYIFDVGFEQVFVLYNPTVYEVGDVIETYTYRVGILQSRFAFTTALGLFRSVIGFALVIGSNYLARRISGGEKGIW